MQARIGKLPILEYYAGNMGKNHERGSGNGYQYENGYKRPDSRKRIISQGQPVNTPNQSKSDSGELRVVSSSSETITQLERIARLYEINPRSLVPLVLFGEMENQNLEVKFFLNVASLTIYKFTYAYTLRDFWDKKADIRRASQLVDDHDWLPVGELATTNCFQISGNSYVKVSYVNYV